MYCSFTKEPNFIVFCDKVMCIGLITLQKNRVKGIIGTM